MSISDVLQVVSTSDLEAFNAAMEASFAQQDEPSFAQEDVDELVGAECWICDCNDLADESSDYAEPLRLTLHNAAKKQPLRHEVAGHGSERNDQVWLADFDAA